jgi:hypothetical protein
MADPVTAMAGVSIAGSAIGGLVGGAGAKLSGDAAAAASTYKAGVAQLNQQINLQNANWALQSGDVQAMESGLKARSVIAQTKVAQSASGFDVNSGTNQAVRDTQSTVSQYDQNVIRFDAAKTAYGYESKAAMDSGEAALDLSAAGTEREAGTLGMISSYINAGTSVASKWLQGKQIGIGS